MAELQFSTSGLMTIKINGITLGRHIQDPRVNVRQFTAHPTAGITLTSMDMQNTDWGRIELIDQGPGSATLTMTIDSDKIGFYGWAQVIIYAANGQKILERKLQSGVHGPIGDAKRTETYTIDNIG